MQGVLVSLLQRGRAIGTLRFQSLPHRHNQSKTRFIRLPSSIALIQVHNRIVVVLILPAACQHVLMQPFSLVLTEEVSQAFILLSGLPQQTPTLNKKMLINEIIIHNHHISQISVQLVSMDSLKITNLCKEKSYYINHCRVQ